MPDRWTEFARFRVHGEPKGQPRPRATVMHVGGVARARMYSDDSADDWRAAVSSAARPHLIPVPLVCPVRVDLVVLMPRPDRLETAGSPAGRSWCTAKPDVDNAVKLVLDALTELRLWKDDAQVVSGGVDKWYAARGEAPGAIVTVSRWAAC